MKIAITGKGGSGKTTISATLARVLARRGFNVLAIDGDPSPNLAAALGVSEEERQKLAPLPAGVLKQVLDDDGTPTIAMAREWSEIEAECAATAPDGVAVLTGYQVQRAGAG